MESEVCVGEAVGMHTRSQSRCAASKMKIMQTACMWVHHISCSKFHGRVKEDIVRRATSGDCAVWYTVFCGPMGEIMQVGCVGLQMLFRLREGMACGVRAAYASCGSI